MLTQRHEVIAIRLFDPRERELPDAGWIVVEDAETGELLSVDTSDQDFRRRFAGRRASATRRPCPRRDKPRSISIRSRPRMTW